MSTPECPVRPLHGWTVTAPRSLPALAEAAHLLAVCGATVRDEDTTDAAMMVRGPAGEAARARLGGALRPFPGLPAAVPARAAGGLLALAALATAGTGATSTLDPDDVALTLLLPRVMAACYRAPSPPRPTPRPWSDGWLAVELGAPGDQETFALLLGSVPADARVQEVSARAQGWRLPVLPYLPPDPRTGPREGSWCRGPVIDGLRGAAGRHRPRPALHPGPAPLTGVRILDATVMWAGPLATWLLAGLGAEVITVEPAARPDGARAPRGGGIYPGGVLVPGDGGRSGLFNALSRGKLRCDLDLRRPAAVDALHQELRGADLWIDNLSPRARGQLSVTREDLRRIRPDLLVLSMPAFGRRSRRRSWVAYGAQVHAVSGLAWGRAGVGHASRDGEPPLPAATAYPDALTGVHAAVAAVAALLGRDAGWCPAADIEVPLTTSAGGLRPAEQDRQLLADDPDPWVARLVRDRPEMFQPLVVDGRPLPHPRLPLPATVAARGVPRSADGSAARTAGVRP